MWTCQRCHMENRDSSTVCELCGTQRSAGRFGSAPSVQQARVGRAQQQRMPQPSSQKDTQMLYSSSPTPYRAADGERAEKQKSPSFTVGFAKCVGIMLMILLPVLTALFAWRQYDAVKAALIPLLLGSDAKAWMEIAVYCILSLIAVLVSFLPGLWTLLLARGKNKER